MAGQKIISAQIAHIDETPEAEELILGWLADGYTVRDVAEMLGLKRNSTRCLYQWRKRAPGRKERWEDALRERAETLAEDTLEIADGAMETPDGIRKAEIRIKARQWLASVSNPERFARLGHNIQNNIQINVADLHLTAVKDINAKFQAEAVQKLALRRAEVEAQHAEYTIEEAVSV